MGIIKTRLRVFFILFLLVLVGGSLSFMAAEKMSFLDALYFSIVTVSTVGYGDISPESPLGKIVSVLIIMAGGGAFVGVVTNATDLMIANREKKVKMAKINLVVGVFFTELGTRLLSVFSMYDKNLESIRQELLIGTNWDKKDFAKIRKVLTREYTFKMDEKALNLQLLHKYLLEKRALIIDLLENPALGEHEVFTDLLHAVMHLAEELTYRPSLDHLPESDLHHLSHDAVRVYRHLIVEWVNYVEHLKESYPFLFSLAMRTNPFDLNASAVIR
jgi:hypothetical protein